LISIVVFAVAYAFAKRSRVFAWVAIVLVALAIALVILPSLAEWMARSSTNPYTVRIETLYITLELLIPAILMVLVQWGLVRRRWLRKRGEEDLTLWPWIATVVAGLAILNPLGLEIISSALNPSSGNLLRQLWIVIALCGAAVLVVAALIEIGVRQRMLRRRRAPIELPVAAEAKT
jgi:hypothetical protein